MKKRFINGNIYTIDASLPKARSLFVDQDRLSYVGDNTEVNDRQTFDLEDLTVIPGMIDAHTHFTDYALQESWVQLRDLTDFDHVLHAIRKFVEQAAPEEWIVGGRWDKNLWQDSVVPHREHLDAISLVHPIALSSKDGHSMWVNSKTLEIIGYTTETPTPSGGEICRDPDTGEPTGLLKEEAILPVFDNTPTPNLSQRSRAVLQGAKNVHALGLTGLHCCESPETFRLYQSLIAEEKLKLRLYHTIPDHHMEDAVRMGLKTGFGNRWLRIGHVKIFSDGALGSQSARMLSPYEKSPGNHGIGMHTDTELFDLINRSAHADLAVAVHAIGDRANRQVLDAIEHTQQKENKRLRHRIEHAQLLHPDDQDRLAKLGVVASMQPVHLAADVKNIITHWGDDRSRYAFPFKTLLNYGTKLAFGSDAPIETIDPFAGIYAAVARKYKNNPMEQTFCPEEKISVHHAVHAYTAGSAYASGEERVKGSLTVGKLADFIVLDRDIFAIKPEEILETKVVATVIGGEIVYGELKEK
ncbi:MAG: hypothetical protein B6244_09730 [Candidatus Cloacimonetes bacterium 4572_55]|nr:MAG: hypothetical protein B6244_09730 [Candidatus Cloacimonetes bacterium 4572_55]